MTEYRKGELLRVTYEARYEGRLSAGGFCARRPDGSGGVMTVPEGATVERIGPPPMSVPPVGSVVQTSDGRVFKRVNDSPGAQWREADTTALPYSWNEILRIDPRPTLLIADPFIHTVEQLPTEPGSKVWDRAGDEWTFQANGRWLYGESYYKTPVGLIENYAPLFRGDPSEGRDGA